MQAGKLRHRVILQTPTITANSYGEPIETFVNTATIWASVEPLSGRDYFKSMKDNAEITHKVTIRYRSDIKPTLRFLFGTRVFDILYFTLPDNRNISVECWCREVIDNGV
jgi:SPP1 family predicted phage head-tail adaptor